MSLRAASSILGKVRSLLVCFPGLRLLTDHLMAFTQLAHKFGYHCSLPVREQALLCKDFLSSWAGRAMLGVKPVRTPVAILGSLGMCIYVPASRHWLISYSPVHLN